MKKSLLFAGLSAIALTACVNDETFSIEQQEQLQAMRFDAPAMKQTRANVMGEITGVEYDARENFMVYAKYYKGDFESWTATGVEDYFNALGDTAKNEGNASKYWSTNATYYWPDLEYNLAFAAYSPADLDIEDPSLSISHTENGLQIKNFTTQANANEQYDLMYSDRVIDRNKTNNGHSAIPLVFQHALSSIVFSTEKEDDAVDYVITDLKLHGTFVQKADFNQNIDEGQNLTSGIAKWENPATATAANFAPSFDEVEVTTVPTQFTQKESALLLIPQGVPSDAAITVNYKKIINPDDPATKKEMENEVIIKLSDFAQENGNKINTWEMGNRYIYRIAFGQNKRIYFEPSTTDWVLVPTLIYVIQ